MMIRLRRMAPRFFRAARPHTVRVRLAAGLAGALLATGAGTAAAQHTDAQLAGELHAYIERAVADWEVTGLAVAVVRDDRVVFARGYGTRDLRTGQPVDTGTRFAIGSTTKAMTAAALGMLVDEGRVAWDDPVIRHLPGFRVGDPYVTRELTVRDLLTHRGGLGNVDQLWSSLDFTTDEIIARVATLQPVYSLRSGFVYQNVMYAVAGAVIEAASGMSWEEFFVQRIFRPLGMNATTPTLAALAGQPNVAEPHNVVGGRIRTITNRSVDAVGPAGSVWSSVDDMARWTRFMLNGGELEGTRLLSESTHAEIMSPQVIAPKSMYPTMALVQPRFFTYGLAWFLHDYDGQAVAMHTGSIDGMSALIGLLPDRGVGVYVLANTDHAELRHALMYRVFDTLTGRQGRDWSADLLRLYGERRAAAAAAQPRRELGTRPSVPLERYAGTYEHPTYGAATVSVRNERLHLHFGSGRIGSLEHWHYDTFMATWEDERRGTSQVVFLPDGTGGVAALRVQGITLQRSSR
jgi:CubicO group peptidase (beta-lactamase class C family)